MKFKKSSPEIIERFEAALPAHPDVEPRQMFGYPCGFVNGNFFAGLFEESVVMRLPDEIRSRVPDMARAEGFNPMGTGKGMSGWYVVPERISRAVAPLAVLLERALGEVRTLPPKVKKTKSPKAKVPAKASSSAKASAANVTAPGTPAAKRAARRKR